MKSKSFVLIAGVALLLTSACTPIGAGLTVGSAAGVAAAREGGIQASLQDAKISAKINDLWLRHDFEMFRKLNLTVDQGRVLITGVVQKPEHRVEAVRLAWQAEEVRQVINEIKVDNSEGIKGWARDNWINGRLKAALLFDKDVQSVNYTIDTVQGIVYLMGIGQDQAELDKVMAHARTIPYVQQVVSYVKLAGTPMNQIIPPSVPQDQPAVQTYDQTYQIERQMVQPDPVQAQPNSVLGAPRAPIYDAYGNPIPPEGVLSGGGVSGRPAPIVDNGF